MLALCLMLLFTYHALNYVGIIGLGLVKDALLTHFNRHSLLSDSQHRFIPVLVSY